MTEHLPECPSTSTDPLAEDCCCARLHACEKRVSTAFHVDKAKALAAIDALKEKP